MANKIEETKYMFHVITLLIRHQLFINKNNLTLVEVMGRSVTKTYMSFLMVDSYALPLITL